MQIRTRVYLFINRLFFGGETKKVTVGSADKKEAEIFKIGTLPLYTEHSQYFTEDSRVLLIGCGTGVEISWLSERCQSVVALDTGERAILLAQEVSKNLANVECFLVTENILPFESNSFDVAFMHNVCEHIIEHEVWFKEYYRLLKKGGILINSFAPLFYSPFGAHLFDVLKIPWGHLIFGFKTTMEVRNMFYPNYNSATTWEERGLNRLTEYRYLKTIKKIGYTHLYYRKNTSGNLPIVAKIPLLKNLFIFQINNVLQK